MGGGGSGKRLIARQVGSTTAATVKVKKNMVPIFRAESKFCVGYRISGVINFVQIGGAGQFLAVDNMNNIFISAILLNTAPFTVIIVKNI